MALVRSVETYRDARIWDAHLLEMEGRGEAGGCNVGVCVVQHVPRPPSRRRTQALHDPVPGYMLHVPQMTGHVRVSSLHGSSAVLLAFTKRLEG